MFLKTEYLCLAWGQVDSFILNSPLPAITQEIGTAEKQKEKEVDMFFKMWFYFFEWGESIHKRYN